MLVPAPTLHSLNTAVLVPAALLSTNFTLGLPLPETVPLVFLLSGLCLALTTDRLTQIGFAWLPLAMIVYGVAGIGFGSLVDGVRVIGAGLVFAVALQLVRQPSFPAACRAAVYVLFVLRLGSMLAPEPFVQLYRILGLRTAEISSGARAILFAEPSYLATATLAFWAIGRKHADAGDNRIRFVDVAALFVLIMSVSASAALYALGAWLIVIRRNVVAVALSAAVIAVLVSSVVVVEANRILIFVRAVSTLLESGNLLAFIQIDPSASWRMTSAVLAWLSALEFPFGQLRLEMSPLLSMLNASNGTPWVATHPLTDDFYGNLQANTVPLQLLVFGGLPLFVSLVVAAIVACFRVLRARETPTANLLIAFSLVVGCVLQSQLTSPFLYLCIAEGLSRARTAEST